MRKIGQLASISIGCLKSVSRLLSFFLLLPSLISCSGGGDEAFNFLEDTAPSSDVTSDVEIIDHTPKSDPVVVTNSGSITFAVTVGSGAGNNLTYAFSLDGNVVQSGPNGFFDLNGSSVGTGAHTLDVQVTNGLTEDSHRFNLQKNTPPQIDSTVPAAAGNIVSCGGGALVFTVESSDVDGDELEFIWKLNSAVTPSVFSSIVSNGGQSVATFAPPCTVSGASVVSVEISDGYDVTSYSWAVSVSNPVIAEITGFTPATSPVIIPSTGSQLFSVSANGKAPLAYSWLLNGTPIGGADGSFFTLTAGSITVGPHTLTARVQDSDSSDERIFNIIRNAAPDLSNPVPVQTDSKLNYRSSRTFSIDATDLNGDSLTYTWTLNGSVSGALIDSPTGTGSQAVLSPTEALVGSHTVRVRVSDGTEYTDHQWVVEVNFFSDSCNELTSGQICTVVGRVGLGSGTEPMDEPSVVNIHPTYVTSDGGSGVFISDQINHIVWYHNLSGASVTRLGVSVEAGQIVALVGNGAPGTTPNGSQNTLYKLNRPEGLAWDSVTESLFIAEYNSHYISRVNSSGVGQRVACSGGTGTSAPAGGAALSHDCRNVSGLALDSSARILYASAYNNNTANNSHIRAFDISDADPANWTGEIFIQGAAAAPGAIGGAARADRAWALDLDSRGVLYWVDGGSSCRLRVANTTNNPISFYGGTVNVPAGETANLTNHATAGCDNNIGPALGGNPGTRFSGNSRGVAVLESSPGVIEGWFVANTGGHRVVFVNNSASSITFGGTAVGSAQSAVVTGTGATGFNGNLLGNLTRVNSPYGVEYMPSQGLLVFGDYSHSRLRALDTTINNGSSMTLAGEDFKYGSSGDGGKAANDVIINSPRGVAVDQAGSKLYFSDSTNGRIRLLDLITGLVTTAVGQGRNNGLAGANPDNPLDVYTGDGGPRELFALENGNILYTDRNGGTGTNRNCVARVYNRLGSLFNFLNVAIPGNKVANLAGDWALGCDAHSEGFAATNSALHHPEGVIYDGTNMYIAIESQHCILRVNPSGVISRLVGSCGSAQYQDGLISDPAVRLRNPTAMFLDPEYADDGNFFFIDAYTQATSYLRYVNQRGTAVTISGVIIPANSVGTLFTAGAQQRLNSVAAFDNQYCFSRGQGGNGPHNVLCRNREDDLGNTTLRVGSSDASPVNAGSPLGVEQEGISSSNATLYEPIGLAFDGDGNLYVTERLNHQIRKIRRWW